MLYYIDSGRRSRVTHTIKNRQIGQSCHHIRRIMMTFHDDSINSLKDTRKWRTLGGNGSKTILRLHELGVKIIIIRN